METLEATFRIVTPMFLGGANQDCSDGIRPPSVKGALRFWWRALNWARFRTQPNATSQSALKAIHAEEGRIFGLSASESNRGYSGGQSSILFQVRHSVLDRLSIGTVHPRLKNLDSARYLGYGLITAFESNKGKPGHKLAGQLDRECICEDQSFQLIIKCGGQIDDSVIEAIKALGLFGALGSRARHGFGSIALESMSSSTGLTWTAPTSIPDYINNIRTLLNDSRLSYTDLLPPFSAFYNGSRIDVLLKSTEGTQVLDEMGKSLLMYRSWGKSEMGNRLPGGAQSEKRFKDDHDWFREILPSDISLGFHPKRVVFGLPHNYHKAHHHVVPESTGRRSSPLLLHVHSISKSQFIGVSLFMKSDFLPEEEKINANKVLVEQKIEWDVITNFLDGKKGIPNSFNLRFPERAPIFPIPEDK